MPIKAANSHREASSGQSDSGYPKLRRPTRPAISWTIPLVGSGSGLIAAIALAISLHNIWVGLILGVLVGVAYAVISQSNAKPSVESIFTGAALGFPLWTVLNIVVIPLYSGAAPQWSAAGMRTLLPCLVGWIIYGALLGILIPSLNALFTRYGPEPTAATPRVAEHPCIRIVILGGGFAGTTTAEQLEHHFGADRRVSFTLISEGNALLFTPMLAEVAGGGLEPSHISSPLRTSLHRTQVLRARVTGIDFEQRCVFADSGEGAQALNVPYDHVVFALGSRANYFGNENVRQNSFDFKALLDAIRIRNHVIGMFELADAEENDLTRQELLRFVIAGGGFAGVELAGALNDFARGILADYPHLRPEDVQVIVVHPHAILPELSPSLGEYARRQMEVRGVRFELGRRVLDAGPGTVKLDTHEIRTRTLVWTAGTAPNPLLRAIGLETDKRGAVLVDSTLAIAHRAGLWALGDCAAVVDAKNGKPCPPTAQFALRQARTLARNIKADLEGRKLDQFHFDSLGALCVVGYHTACAELNLPRSIGKALRFSGLLAWLMWRGIYLSKLPGFERKIRVFLDWNIELFFPRDIVQTIDLK